jgi:hypothetical protein
MSAKKDTESSAMEDPSEKKKRPESRYNASVLRQCIKEGLDAKSIMEKMDIAHKPTLKHYVLKLISDDRTFYDVKGLYLKSSSRPYVNKKGEVHFNIHKVDLGDMEIKEGDEFVITAEDGRIILTVV